jgi:hypothetical protein
MKYMLLIYNNIDALMSLPKDELDGVMGEVDTIMSELRERGELIGGHALAHPSQTKTVRVRDGAVATTDGPFVEAKEHLGGLTIVEAEDLDAALAWGRRLAEATTLPIEVRPFRD